MIQIDVRFEGAGEIGALPEHLRWALQRLIAREAEQTARDMKQEMARQRIAATSLALNSVRADPVDPLEWHVGPHVAHARYVLEGRRPGGKMPPWRAIRDWMKVKRLGDSRASVWAIARAIQRRGIRPRDFMTPVAERLIGRLRERGATAVDDALRGGNVG